MVSIWQHSHMPGLLLELSVKAQWDNMCSLSFLTVGKMDTFTDILPPTRRNIFPLLVLLEDKCSSGKRKSFCLKQAALPALYNVPSKPGRSKQIVSLRERKVFSFCHLWCRCEHNNSIFTCSLTSFDSESSLIDLHKHHGKQGHCTVEITIAF